MKRSAYGDKEKRSSPSPTIKDKAVIDNGSTYCCLGKEWYITRQHPESVNINSPIYQSVGRRTVQLVDGETWTETVNGSYILIKAFHCCPTEFTSILASNQIRKEGNTVHNQPNAFGRQQHLHLASGTSLKLHYKGGVLVLKLQKPQEGDVLNYIPHKLTSEEG